MIDHHRSRRNVLGLLGGVVGAAVLGGSGVARSATTTAAADASGPAVEWRRHYEGRESEYSIQGFATVFQTEDGGYALPGSGAPGHETGPEDEQFLLVKTDESGKQQGVAFANTDRDTEGHWTTDGVRTSDGGYGLVGRETYRYTEGERSDGSRHERVTNVAAASKIDSTGRAVWTATLDALEADETEDEYAAGNEDSMRFTSATSDTAGGFVAGGSSEATAVLVQFDGDGTVAWERHYEGFVSVEQTIVSESGYLLVVTDSDGAPSALHVDDAGELQREVPLDVDRNETPHNYVFVPTTDGGYAYTGRDQGHENMILGTLNDAGEHRWRTEYDGPGRGKDWAFDVVQTEDGGYALGGYMSEADSGDPVPAVLKTDANGTEAWRTLITEDVADARVDTLIQTEDEGYACRIDTTLVKLAPAAESRSTRTAADSPDDDSPENGGDAAPAADTPDGSEPTPDEQPTARTEVDESTATGTYTPTAGDNGGPTATGADSGTSTATETNAPTGNAGGTGGDDAMNGDGATNGGGPGFDVLAALVGVAGLAALRRSRT